MIFHSIFCIFLPKNFCPKRLFQDRKHLINCKNNTGSLMVLNLVFCHTSLTRSVY